MNTGEPAAAYGAATTGPAGPAVQVLLIEDDDGDAFLVSELLSDDGPDVELHRVRTISEAASLLPGTLDCVLLDLGLPDASDLDGLRLVLELAPRLAVLVLTGLSDEYRGTAAVAVGAQDYLIKGNIDGQLLIRAIRYAVERKRADESVRRLYASEARAAENARLERGLLPRPLLLGDWLRVVSRYRPGRHQSLLGGDFFDVVEREHGTVYALIGDVAGHGPDEAALGVSLRIAWRTLVLAGIEPDSIFAGMHAVLVSERSTDEVFATVAMVRLRSADRRLEIWRAGHPLPVVIGRDGTNPVPPGDGGVALGVLDGCVWPLVTTTLGESESLLLFTDGLIEGFDGTATGARLGEAPVYRLLEDLTATEPEPDRLLDRLLDAVRERNGGELTDDVALVLLGGSWLA